jgi:hypothetical protein
LESPVTVIAPPDPDAVCPPGEAVTVYEVIAAPPSEAGGANATVAWPFPAMAVTLVGAPGAIGVVPGKTVFDTADGTLSPSTLWAVTVNV